MTPAQRDAAHALAQQIHGADTTDRDSLLAAGLLAERAEVLAGRAEIQRLTDDATTCAALAIRNASAFARDLTAAQGAIARRRADLLAVHETHMATSERLAAVLAGVERVIAEARGV